MNHSGQVSINGKTGNLPRDGNVGFKARSRVVLSAMPAQARSLNPRPLKIIGTHLSARAARVFACFARET